jgi:selenocysteine-specific elongation factor
VDTFGGGEVVDVNPQAGRAGTAASPDPAHARIAREGLAGMPLASWAKEMGLAPSEAEDLASQAVAAGSLRRVGARLYAGEAWERAAAAVAAALRTFHESEPLRRGMALEPLRAVAAAGLPQEAWRALVTEMSERGTVRRDADRVALSEHRVVMSAPDREAAERIDDRFRRAGLDPPDVEDVLRGEPGDVAARIVEWLVDEGRLTRIQDGRLFHAEALADLRARLRARAAVSKTIDVATFKELFGVTRRNAIPLLEQLDAERTTRRVGNVREILSH